MNSRSLRRLAADHGALHSQELPPYFLFPADAAQSDDLTQLDILIAGPTHTPFENGVWKLHLSIPTNYPQQPPTANFRTPIFHPNVEPQTGGVCVETLKRDWDSKLTLRDVLITISCLLITPNPDSALNADAGQLIQEDYANFTQRAQLMTSIHAGVPRSLQAAVKEAQNRGEEVSAGDDDESEEQLVAPIPEAPVRRRRTIAKVRGRMAGRWSDASPSGMPARRRPHPPHESSFRSHSRSDDVFGEIVTPPQLRFQAMPAMDEEDDSMADADQENDLERSPAKPATPPLARTPRRPHGAAAPLGELIMDQDEYETSEDNEMEAEYPPSPRKSPTKTPAYRGQRRPDQAHLNIERPESSHQAAMRAPNLTPPNYDPRPLAESSMLMDITMEPSPSPRKLRRELFATAAKRKGKAMIERAVTPEPKQGRGMFKTRAPSSAERQRADIDRRAKLDAKLWRLCGGDIKKWNRGEFDGAPFATKAGRW
ncbi:uncharacterized protein RCC_02786 [Ramularia collo-cygni]|uniref:Ubiquitin-conjugating enzyme E2 2 n=1 Tax=Ramularia collo-cygni TaxID=112498 RepID=A0A2D3V380_9PEZI|nr:uncharacterized protein RCC_02786 [Ramularia collo-cygni]CZT16954.1 uncharacterized protein RCC_02786 [Ramularia collo-cygni]